MNNRVALAGLVAFLVVDVGLVALALRAGRETPVALPQTSSTPIASPTSPATPTTTTPSPSFSTSSPSAVPVTRLVSALDATTAWRATTGSCDSGGATMQVTRDGGDTWTTVRSPAPALARIQPVDKSRAFVVGSGSDCAPKQYATRDLGRKWQPPTAVSGGWARRLDEPTRVLTPRASKATPCGDEAVLDLSRTSGTQAQALCADGSVVRTDDGGDTWTASGEAPGAVALGNVLADRSLRTYAVRTVDGCTGVQLVQVAKGKDANVIDCVPVGSARPGEVGLSVTDRAAWIVAGDQTWVSRGDLTSWKRV